MALYLKRVRLPDGQHYILRESFSDHGVFKSRDLLDMGEDPSEFIRYPGGNGFYFDSLVEETLQQKGVPFTSEDIEQIFEPFLEPRYREIIARFQHRHSSRAKVACDLGRVVPEQREVHIFDARRLYYLRFGRMDSGELGSNHWKWLNIFLCKSRDEIESLVDAMERQLPPREFATYVYASLGIPLLFPKYLRDHPVALDQAKLDEYILDELCRLNSDERFFIGVEKGAGNGLHPYLAKYAWFYFDYGFQSESWSGGPGFGAHFNRPASPPPRPSVSVEAAYGIFGITAEQFSSMSRKDVIRIYRRKAKKLHPDRGGVHEEFVKLSEAYEQLILRKK